MSKRHSAVRGPGNVPVWYALLSLLIVTATMGLTGSLPVFGNPSPNPIVIGEVIVLGGIGGVWHIIRQKLGDSE